MLQTDGENDLKRHLSDLLYDPHSPFIEGLEALFTHFDANSDGSITYDEFTRGVHSLMEYLGKDYKDSDMAKYVTFDSPVCARHLRMLCS